MRVSGDYGSMCDLIACLHDDLQTLSTLSMLSLCNTSWHQGLHRSTDIQLNNGLQHDRHIQTTHVYSSWSQLKELYYSRIDVGGLAGPMVSACTSCLVAIHFHYANLTVQDIESIAESKHIATLEELSVEYNELSGAGHALCEIATKATKLQVLNIKETALSVTERCQLLLSLQGSNSLHTLCLYESHEVLDAMVCGDFVQLACHICSIRELYVFAISAVMLTDYQYVHSKCLQIIMDNNRQDMKILW